MKTTRGFLPALLALPLLFAPIGLGAEVLDSSPAGFTVRSVRTIAAPPEVVWKKLPADIGRWWDPEHTWSGDAANLSLRAEAGSCFCEKLPPDGSVKHMEVVLAWPRKTLRLVGGLGPLQSEAVHGVMSFDFEKVEGGTKLTMTYTVSGHRKGGVDLFLPPVERVLGEMVERFATFVETGKPVRPAAPAK